MTASKKKGTWWESAIAAYLMQSGWRHAERRTLNGVKDRGDISGIPGVIIEAKNARDIRLATWIDETEQERVNAAADVGALWIHRPRKSLPEDGYVVVTGRQFVGLLKQAGY